VVDRTLDFVARMQQVAGTLASIETSSYLAG
jgi:hypothetical protein